MGRGPALCQEVLGNVTLGQVGPPRIRCFSPHVLPCRVRPPAGFPLSPPLQGRAAPSSWTLREKVLWDGKSNIYTSMIFDLLSTEESFCVAYISSLPFLPLVCLGWGISQNPGGASIDLLCETWLRRGEVRGGEFGFSRR